MRDPNRILIIISKLMTAWTAAPDLRLGQLISNAHSRISGSSAELFHVEDDLLSAGLDAIIASQKVNEIVKLRTDIERIGRERDQMAAANVELQERLSRLELRAAHLKRIAQLRGAPADALNADPERIEAEARASAQPDCVEGDHT